MKKFLILLALMFLIGLANADFLGIFDNDNAAPDDSVWVYLPPYDSLALKFETPDTIFVWRIGPAGDTTSADTITSLSAYKRTPVSYQRRYRASNGSSAQGQYTVAIWGGSNGNYQTIATHCYNVITNGLSDLTRVIDSLQAVVDTLQNHDNWVAKEASLFNGNLNLDNATGTLAASQFESNFLTAALIADDAIDYGTFAGTAPTAWWNEGKTGYSLASSGLNGVTQGSGYVLSRPDLDNASGTLANSQIDDDVDVNMKTVTAGVITAASFAQAFYTAMRDSFPEFIFEADTATHNNVAESFGRILSNPSYVQGSGSGGPSAWTTADTNIVRMIVWGADTSAYNGVAGSYGLILATPAYVQGAGGDPWSTALPGSYGAGTAGKIVGDNVNATISSRSTFNGNLNLDNATGSLAASQFETSYYAIISDTVGMGYPTNFALLSIDGSGYVTVLNHGTIVQNALTAQGYTTARAGKLDSLDNIPTTFNNLSGSDIQTALTNQGYTSTRAGYLDRLDENVSTARSTIMAALRDSAYYATLDLMNADSATADTGDGSVGHKLLSDAAGGSAPTVEQIYAEFIDGTNEDAFKADVSGCTGGGSGSFACTLYVFDDADTSAVQGVSVTVAPLTGGSPYAVVSTDENGMAITSLNSGTFAYLLFRQGKAFNAVDTITISEAQTDTLWCEDITVTSPPANMTKCRFWVSHADADTMQGVVFEWQLVDSVGNELPDTLRVKIENTVLSKRPKSTVSDSSYFEVNFYPNSLMNYTWSRYRMTIIYPNGDIDENPHVEVPDTTVFDPF